jgi:proteic killer suppression protein
VIKSFRHRGVEKFFLTGSKAGIQAKHAVKLNTRLTVLDIAEGPQEMNQAGWDLHRLKGDMDGLWAVNVSGNWRLTFGFDGKDAVLVDYQDYH